ncbi:helix-turn-helix domain-containing protein [Arenicellales bacterium IMCC55707]
MDKTDAIFATTPGEILRAARELQGWSIESVAEELRLLPNVVEALENDDYSHTAGWTYAVGYLRNYARLAGVSIEQAITDRKELLPPKEDGPGTMTEPVRNRMQPIAIQYRWVATGAVLLLVFGGLYAAYLNRSTDVERSRLDLVEQSRSEIADPEPGANIEVASTRATESESAPAQNPLANLAVTLEDPTGLSSDSDSPVDSLSIDTGAETALSLDSSNASADVSMTVPDEASGEHEDKSQTPNASNPTSAAEKSETKNAAEVELSLKKKVDAQRVTVSNNQVPSSSTAEQSATAQPQQRATSASSKDITEPDSPVFATAQSSASSSSEAGLSQPLSPGMREIMIKVRESTHVMVWDRDDKVLLRRYMESGKVVSLAGLPPFTLQISYPEGTSIVYGGREFSVPVPKNGINAKIRVGKKL